MPLFREEKYNASALVSEISNADNTQTISAESFMLIPLTNNISISQQTYNVEATVKWASTRENLSSEGCEQQKAQTSLRFRAVWSVPLFFAFWKVSLPNLPQAKFQLSS